MKERTYRYYQDPGHGWIAVGLRELEDLGIAQDISHHSYRRGGTVYLEEDDDAGKWVAARVAAGMSKPLIKSVYCKTSSRIRGHHPYRWSPPLTREV